MALFQVVHGGLFHGGKKLVQGDRFEGDPDALNLLIQRGTIALVDELPTVLEAPEPEIPETSTPSELININQAPKSRLRSLPSIGVAKAAQILEKIAAGEPFTEQSLKDFLGLPDSDWETLRSLITF